MRNRMTGIRQGSRRSKPGKASQITASKSVTIAARSMMKNIISTGAAVHIRENGVVRFGGAVGRPSSKP